MRPPGEEAAFDAEALYRRYERPLRAWLSRRVTATPTLVEDACASAWLILLAKRLGCGERVFGWLRTTALHEAYRLLREERREPASDELDEPRVAFVPAQREDPEAALEAKRALLALASLNERQRCYMAWQVGGFSYREMQQLAGGATYTWVISGRLRQRRGAGCLGCRRHVADARRRSHLSARSSGVSWRCRRALGLRSHAFGRSRG